jgi:hypothetical protein
MKKLFALVLTFQGFGLFAQTSFNLSGSFATGFQSNVFNAPNVYVRPQGDTLTNDSLFVRDQLLNIALNADLKWNRKRNYFSWKTDFELDRYASIKQANSTEIDSWLRYSRKKKKEKINPSAYLRLRSSSRLGLNVLGSELLTPFSFRQVELGSSLIFKISPVYNLQTQISYTFKDYDKCINCGINNESVSLTQRQFDIGVIHEFLADKKKRRKKFVVSTLWQDRSYSDWINYELLDPNRGPNDAEPFLPFNPNVEYQPRRWRYLITEFSYNLPISKAIDIKPQIEFTRRYDVSNGDFGSRQWSADIFTLLKSDSWSGRFRAGYTFRNYTDRLADQAAGTPFPLLVYRYFRTSLRIEKILGEKFALWTEASYTSRESNTDLLTTRVRRSYTNGAFFFGLRVFLDGKVNPKNSKSS